MTFEALLEEVGPLINRSYVGGKMPVTAREKMLVCLEHLATKLPYRTLATLYGRTSSCVWKSVDDVTKVLQNTFSEKVKWVSPQDFDQVEHDFRSIAGFPGVIGAIDGCQIQITAPVILQKDYSNRKFTKASNMLAIY